MKIGDKVVYKQDYFVSLGGKSEDRPKSMGEIEEIKEEYITGLGKLNIATVKIDAEHAYRTSVENLELA